MKKTLRRRLLQLWCRTRFGSARLRLLLLTRGVRHVLSAMTIAKVLRQASLTRHHRRRTKRYRRVFVLPRPG